MVILDNFGSSMVILDNFHDCPWTPISCFALAFCYFCLFVFVSLYLRKLIIGTTIKRGAQKLFLVVVLINNVLRLLYFVLWPLYGECTPTLKESLVSPWLHVLGNLPGSVFLSAFSVLVWTFARIYHLILRQDIRGDETKYHCVMTILVVVNIAMYAVTIIDLATESTMFGPAPVYAITGTSGSLSLLFLAYGALSYVQVKSVLGNAGRYPYLTPPAGDGEHGKEMIYPSILSTSEVTVSDDEQASEDDVPYGGGGSVSRSVMGGMGTPRGGVTDVESDEESSPLRTPTGDYLPVPPGPEGSSKKKGSTAFPGVQMSPKLSNGTAWPPSKKTKTKKTKTKKSKSSSHHQTVHRYDEIVHVPPVKKKDKRQSRNPMRKIAIVAATCCCCFLLRTGLLGMMIKKYEEQPWGILVPYFCVAEVIPLMLLLYVFNSSATWTSPDALRELTKADMTRMGAHSPDHVGENGGGGGGRAIDDGQDPYGGLGYQQPLLD